ncbi:hypothetical protein ABVF61_20645 [Roseibium sp. HPY-6]|uniref:hypothetical protein n=1 Tax=Roseibium sp. HPY-6 TaxID=3229852 RepID=UPI00339076D8
MIDWGGFAMAAGCGAIGAASVWGLSASAQPNAVRRGHICFLSYGWPVKCLAASLVPLAILFVYAMAHAPAKQIAFAFVITAGFLAMTIFVNYQVFFVRLGYDRNFIHFNSPFMRSKSVSWDNLEFVGRSALVQADYIEVAGIGRIWCSSFSNGYDELGQFLERKTDTLLASQA